MLLAVGNSRSCIRTGTLGDVWHAIPANDVVARVESATAGLTAAEAARRLALDGPNRIPAPRRHWTDTGVIVLPHHTANTSSGRAVGQVG